MNTRQPSHSHRAPPSPTTDATRGGMTLRDWFAGQALAGILSNPDLYYTDEEAESLAVRTYAIADTMLKERDKKPDGGTSPAD